MFTAHEKDRLAYALEMLIASDVRAQKAGRYPEMAPVYEAALKFNRQLLEKVRNVKATG